jgi:hypothetical protein
MKSFKGYVPDAPTAVEMGRPLMRTMMGAEYVKQYEPLFAEKFEGRWIVRGKGPALREGHDITFEPVFIAIDPWSARLISFGWSNPTNLQRLHNIPLDGPKSGQLHASGFYNSDRSTIARYNPEAYPTFLARMNRSPKSVSEEASGL